MTDFTVLGVDLRDALPNFHFPPTQLTVTSIRLDNCRAIGGIHHGVGIIRLHESLDPDGEG